MPEVESLKITYDIKRSADAIPCPCGGYADRVETTTEERDEYGCGFRERLFECCARAFVCRVCGKRLVGTAEAPEME
jgi:hypothetical protein